jgi:hypothetical protein
VTQRGQLGEPSAKRPAHAGADDQPTFREVAPKGRRDADCERIAFEEDGARGARLAAVAGTASTRQAATATRTRRA